MSKTKIEWAEQTWNPIVGCSVVSPGCTNCYAMGQAHRIKMMTEGRTGNPADTHYYGTTKVVNGNPVWTGKVALAPEKTLLAPLRRKKPTMYFVNSMGDLFHEDVPDEWIDRVFAVMALCPQHTFQVLTKRSKRLREYIRVQRSLNGVGEHIRKLAPDPNMSIGEAAGQFGIELGTPWWPLPNVWLGVSAEDQVRADERIFDLLDTPAALRFVSCEPLLEFLQITTGQVHNGAITTLDWVICGGESGKGARPMHPDWVRSLRDQCVAADVPFFFKQWGEWAPTQRDKTYAEMKARSVRGTHFWPDGVAVDLVGKNAAGHMLDGQEWRQMPASEGGVERGEQP